MHMHACKIIAAHLSYDELGYVIAMNPMQMWFTHHEFKFSLYFPQLHKPDIPIMYGYYLWNKTKRTSLY